MAKTIFKLSLAILFCMHTALTFGKTLVVTDITELYKQVDNNVDEIIFDCEEVYNYNNANNNMGGIKKIVFTAKVKQVKENFLQNLGNVTDVYVLGSDTKCEGATFSNSLSTNTKLHIFDKDTHYINPIILFLKDETAYNDALTKAKQDGYNSKDALENYMKQTYPQYNVVWSEWWNYFNDPNGNKFYDDEGFIKDVADQFKDHTRKLGEYGGWMRFRKVIDTPAPTASTSHWYTACLPFDLSFSEITDALGLGAEVCTFDKVMTVDEETTFYFNTDNFTITAGTPYMVHPAKEITGRVYDQAIATLTSKTATASAPTEVKVAHDKDGSITSDAFTFKGQFNDGASIPANAFFYSMRDGNTGWYHNTGAAAGSWRSYTCVVEDNGNNINFAKMATFSAFTTGIKAIATAKPRHNSKIYSLSGQCMGDDADHLSAGIYIRNGKKFVIR